MRHYSKEVADLLAAGPLNPHEGSKHDPAHPAVYPTGIIPKAPLDSSEWKIFDLIVRRFLATFGEPATKESSRVTVKVGRYSFFIHGSRLLQNGWLTLYKPYARFEEFTLPPMSEGQEVRIDSLVFQEKTTQPPPRYNPSSLLRAMEDAGIGTKATRADIIDTLYRRGYVKDQRMSATPLAFTVTEILSKYCPKIIDAQFTHDLEIMMEQIELGKETRERIVSETIAYLKPIFENIKQKENEIGSELTSIVRELSFSSVTLSIPCPKCGLSLKVVKNPKSKKRFIGCSGKFKSGCSFALPLPQFGVLMLLDKRCPACNFQMVQVRSKGRKSMITCPSCFASKSKSEKR
jgi:DNA topoisomerase-1